MNRVLNVYLHQELAGKLAHSEGRLAFTYHPAYCAGGQACVVVAFAERATHEV